MFYLQILLYNKKKAKKYIENSIYHLNEHRFPTLNQPKTILQWVLNI
jgi:hypothetical protein